MNFCSDYDAITFDIMLEDGFRPSFVDHRQALNLWILGIRGKVKATCLKMGGARRGYNLWRFAGGTQAFVKTGQTDELFSEIQHELSGGMVKTISWGRELENGEIENFLDPTWTW